MEESQDKCPTGGRPMCLPRGVVSGGREVPPPHTHTGEDVVGTLSRVSQQRIRALLQRVHTRKREEDAAKQHHKHRREIATLRRLKRQACGRVCARGACVCVCVCVSVSVCECGLM